MSFTVIIIVITAIVSFLAFNNEELRSKLLLWPNRMNSLTEYYRLLTCGFVHSDIMHLLFNMLTLFLWQGLLNITVLLVRSDLFPALLLVCNSCQFYAIIYQARRAALVAGCVRRCSCSGLAAVAAPEQDIHTHIARTGHYSSNCLPGIFCLHEQKRRRWCGS